MLKREPEAVDLWAEAEDRNRLPPAIAESSKKLNDCLRRLYNLELKSDFDRLESVGSIDEVIGISERLESAEAVANEFTSFNYRRKSALRKVEQVKAVGKRVNDALASLALQYFNEFKERIVELEGEENLERCRQLREGTDEADKQYKRLRASGKKRRVEFRFDVKATFADYEEKKEAREEMRKRVNSLYERYQSADMKDKIEKIRREIGRGWLSDSEIVKSCRNAGYHEGIIRVKNLEEDINEVLRDLGIILRKKKSIRAAIESMEKNYKLLEDMIKGKKSLKELREIEGNVNPAKYQSYGGMIYFEGDVAEYRKAAEKVLEKVNWIKENKEKIYEKTMGKPAANAQVKGPDKTRQYFEGLLSACKNKDERHRLYVQAVDDDTVKRGSVDGSIYFGISYNLKRLGENERYAELRDILDADKKAEISDLVQLSSKIKEMTDAERFAEDKKDLEHIEGFYCCVREPLRRGAFLRLRTPENEKAITKLLNNFERYIAISRKHLITQGSLQYSKAG
jgi:hypothetical protein